VPGLGQKLPIRFLDVGKSAPTTFGESTTANMQLRAHQESLSGAERALGFGGGVWGGGVRVGVSGGSGRQGGSGVGEVGQGAGGFHGEPTSNLERTVVTKFGRVNKQPFFP